MEPSYFTITSVLKVRPNAYEDKAGVDFKCSEYGEKIISALSKHPDSFKAGSKVFGLIEEKQKGDKTYYNYVWKKDPNKGQHGGGMSSEQFQKLYGEVFAARQEIVMIRQLLQEKGVIPKSQSAMGVAYPESTGPTAFDDLESLEALM